MYKYSQPSLDITKLKNEELYKEELYSRYYLSEYNYLYIKDMFMKAYNMESIWETYLDLLKTYLTYGGMKNDVSKSPALETFLDKEDTNKVLELIDNCKNYYQFNLDEQVFGFNISNYSPTSNKEMVINYWKNKGKDIEIKDFNIENIYFKEE